MGYKVHSVDGDQGELSLAHVRAITKEIVLASPTAGTHAVWRAPVACHVTAVRGYRVGGTGATVNAQKNASDLLAADLSLTTADAWISSTTVQNDAMAVGDKLLLEVASVAGTPTEVTVQVDLLVDVPA
jgi:hypothetical protein